MTSNRLLAVLALLMLAACSKEDPPRLGRGDRDPPFDPPPPAAPVAAPAPAPAPAPSPAAEPAATPAAVPVPPARSVPAKASAPAPVPPPAAAHVKVGDAKCRMCHKLQHDSWSESPHKAKGLDCEGCHGGGADFTKVMRDRTAAIAAGLVLPKKEFCKKCHKADWQDGMLLRVHAHKVK